jgi:hypothetical protein
MDPDLVGLSLPGVLFACIVCGSAGGLAFDLTEPILRQRRERQGASSPPATTDPPASADEAFGDNRVAIPHRVKSKRRDYWEAGFLGPMFVGSIAALGAVMLLAVNRPDAPSTLETAAITRVVADQTKPPFDSETAKKITTAVEEVLVEPRAPYVMWEKLIPIALIAGFAGVAVLRVARGRLLTAIGAVEYQARTAGIREGAAVVSNAVAMKAEDTNVSSVPSEAAPVLMQAASSAVDEHIQQLEVSRSSDW